MNYIVGEFGELVFNVDNTEIKIFLCEKPYVRINKIYSPIQLDCYNKKGNTIKIPKNYDTPHRIRFVLPFQIMLEWEKNKKRLYPLTIKDTVLLKKLVKIIKKDL